MLSNIAWILCSIAACAPALLMAQGNCVNIAGLWSMDEKATLRCNATVAGQTETTSDPLSASRSVTIVQDSGSCSFNYDPGNIGAGTLIQYARRQVTGNITGNSVTTSGGALIPAAGAQLIESSFQASGSVSGNNMTLSGSGPARIKQTVEGGLVADISCTLTSTATFVRNSPGPAPVPLVLNAASFLTGSVAPGEIVSIFGAQMGPAAGVSGQLNADGRLDTSLAGVTVQFDGIPAPLFYVRSDQINAQVPYATSGKSVTGVKVLYQSATSSESSLPVTLAAPAIFAYSDDGTRAVVLNQSGAFNSATNPAIPGEFITLFATGEGQTNPPGIDGKPADAPYPLPIAPVTLQIDAQNADIQYAGAAPGFAGLMQMNARVPASIAGRGIVPVQLFVGGVSSPRVTMAVQGPSPCAACSDLSITITASPNPVASGGNLTYTIAVRNIGTVASANAVVTDNLPANVTYKSSSSSLLFTRSGNTLTFNLGSLAAGANVVINIVVAAPAVTASTTISNVASVSVAGDPNPANNQTSQTTTVAPGATLSPAISSISPTSATQGQTVSSFTVNGSNFQPASTLSFSGTGIAVNSYSSRMPGQIVSSITLAANAATGPRTVLVTNPDSQQASGTFTVNTPVSLVSVPTLLMPINNAVVKQSDPASGCSANPTRGYGWRILFDWTDSTSPNGIQGYQLYVIDSGAAIPGIDTYVAKSESNEIACNSFVIDQNLQGWQWRVRAQDNRGNYSDWTPWSTFQYAPCRLANGTACYAPTQ